MNPYEILLMFDPELADERQTEIVARMRELVEQSGGSWLSHDLWGRKRLAYEIDHKEEGVYHFVTFDASPQTLEEMSRVLKITDGVMRHLAVRRIEAHRAGPKAPAASVQKPEYAAANTRSQEEE